LDYPTGPLYRERYWHERLFDAVERVKELAQACGVSSAQLAIAWLLQRPAVTSVILGATRLEHLQEALKALDVKLEPATIEALDAVAPP
jgi:aryl-alcohol dehydrogenase-like predicted oxidoreductase